MRAKILPLLLFVALVGCASKTTTSTTPAAPTPPQITVAQAVNALAQAVDGAVTSAIAARDAGKVSQADIVSIEAVCQAIAVSGKAVDQELRSSDTWDVQKTKILQLVTQAGISALKAKVSPVGQTLIVSLVTIYNQIATTVGGPAI